MAVRINSLFLLVVLWLSMKYCHYSNASETNELDPAMAGGMYVASKLLEKGALWWSVSGWEGANWNRWPVWLCSLLLLCGDVELNPGPNWRNPRSVCCRPVSANQHGIYCEVCLNWNHRNWVNMSLEDYFHWGHIKDGWVCPRCDREALPFHNVSRLSSSSSNLTNISFSSTFANSNLTNTVCPSPLQLSVFYFNARSLLPKIDEVRALYANEH